MHGFGSVPLDRNHLYRKMFFNPTVGFLHIVRDVRQYNVRYTKLYDTQQCTMQMYTMTYAPNHAYFYDVRARGEAT